MNDFKVNISEFLMYFKVQTINIRDLLGILQELLKEEENKYCADCEAKQPR